ncbi:unnamed protein product, partial [Adineta steineri]
CYIGLLCRLCYIIQTIDGHCCTVAEGVLDPSLVELFSSIIEETTVMNSVRTQVPQAENIRAVILINEINNKLYLDYPIIFNNITVIYWQHWSTEILVQNGLYHLKILITYFILIIHIKNVFLSIQQNKDVQWLNKNTSENTAHLLASMHLSFRQAN